MDSSADTYGFRLDPLTPALPSLFLSLYAAYLVFKVLALLGAFSLLDLLDFILHNVNPSAVAHFFQLVFEYLLLMPI
jgi:hypothetical protein